MMDRERFRLGMTWIPIALLLLSACSVRLPTRGEHVAVRFFESPAFLSMEGPDAKVVTFNILGRTHRGIPVGSVLTLERPLHVPALAHLIFGFAGKGTLTGNLSVMISFTDATSGEQHELFKGTIRAPGDAREWVRSVRVRLDDVADHWGTLIFTINLDEVEEGGHIWVLEPVVATPVEPEPPWVPVHDPVEAMQQFRILQTEHHILWIWVNGLAFDDLKLEALDRTPWPRLAAFVADAALFERVVPMTSRSDQNFLAAFTGTTSSEGPRRSPGELLKRAMYRPILYADARALFELGLDGFAEARSTGDLNTLLPWLRNQVLTGHRIAVNLALQYGSAKPDEARRAIERTIAAFEEAGILKDTVIYIVGTGRVNETDIRPGFLAVRVPGGVSVPNDRVVLPMSVQDILPTMADVMGVSKKDLRFTGKSRYAWLFQLNHDREEPVWADAGGVRWAVFNDWKIRVDAKMGEVKAIEALDPRMAARMTDAYEAFLKRYIGAWFRSEVAPAG